MKRKPPIQHTLPTPASLFNEIMKDDGYQKRLDKMIKEQERHALITDFAHIHDVQNQNRFA